MEATKETGRIRVRAVRLGFYGNRRRRPGEVFDLKPVRKADGTILTAEEQFSDAKGVVRDGKKLKHRGWMTKVDPDTPLKSKTKKRVAQPIDAEEEPELDRVDDMTDLDEEDLELEDEDTTEEDLEGDDELEDETPRTLADAGRHKSGKKKRAKGKAKGKSKKSKSVI